MEWCFRCRTVRSGVGVALRSGGEVVLGSRGSGSKLLALRYAQEVKLLGSLGRTLRSFRDASAQDSWPSAQNAEHWHGS